MRRMHFGGRTPNLATASLLLLAAAICSPAQTLLTNIATGSYPMAIALNPATNKNQTLTVNTQARLSLTEANPAQGNQYSGGNGTPSQWRDRGHRQ